VRNLFETCIDVGSGLILSTLIQLFIFPFFDMYPTVLESFHIAVIFTVISICRSWFWRTIFGKRRIVYCHPMYDTKIPKFVKKAMESKCLTVFLLPASTNSLYFHKHFWDNINHKPRDNVQVRFLRKSKDEQHGFKMATDDGELPERGYLRPLMIVVVDRRRI
jgi:hypothetical protein